MVSKAAKAAKAAKLVVLGAVFSLSLTGCATKSKMAQATGEYATSTLGSADQFSGQDPWGRSEDELRATRTYHFAFDRFDLSDKDKYAVNAHARYLSNASNQKITIEGDTDERGSAEYNVALGERRANSVREQLQTNGISHEKVRVVSYGKARPSNPGHDEAAWAENRRATIVYEGQGA